MIQVSWYPVCGDVELGPDGLSYQCSSLGVGDTRGETVQGFL